MKDRTRWIAGAIFGLALAIGTSGAASAADESGARMTASQEKAFDMIAMSGFGGGIWANYIPDGVTGEFDSYDPVGLMAGDLIKADCSLSWRGPEGKTYCFSTAPSLVYFQDFPERNIRKAKKAYESLTSGKPGS